MEKRAPEKKVRKKRNRNRRVLKLDYLGLEEGKLYKFNGNYRMIYSDKNIYTARPIEKFRRNDHLIFIKGDIWRNEINKTTSIWKKWLENDLEKLKKKYEILDIQDSAFSQKMVRVTYKSKYPTFSGVLYVGYQNKFGWINIVQMTKDDFLRQFNKIELE
jgi:hypothetical protein